jgi:hypothetical protein
MAPLKTLLKTLFNGAAEDAEKALVKVVLNGAAEDAAKALLKMLFNGPVEDGAASSFSPRQPCFSGDVILMPGRQL